MNIDLSNAYTMGIKSNYSGIIRDKVDTPEEMEVQQRIDRLELLEERKADKYIQHDNNKYDLAKEKGIVSTDNLMGGTAYLEYDPETNMPKIMKRSNNDGRVESKVAWDKEGHIDELYEKRENAKQTETIEMKHDHKNGVIFYEERCDKKWWPF